MRAQRLSAAERAGLDLPDDLVLVGPAIDDALPDLPDLRIVSDDARVHARWPARAAQEMPRAQMALVCLPRSKPLARHLIALAAARAERVIIDGQKTDGVDAIYRELRARLGDMPSVSKAHGRLFWLEGADLSDWRDPGPRPGPDGLMVQAGVFSADAIDPATASLIAALPALRGSVADLGAGWGALAHAAWAKGQIDTLHLVESDARALDCARLNLAEAPAQYHWADATDWHAPQPVNTVIMNPPFHEGRRGDPGLGAAFIASAARNLTARGDLWMVANRHLPYEDSLAQHFAQVDELPGTPAFKLFHAARPRQTSSRS